MLSIRDKNITKTKYHQYFVNGVSHISVSKFIKTLFEEFDEEKIISYILKSKNMSDINYKYYNMNKQDIKNAWKQSMLLGTELHSYIEYYYNKILNIDHTIAEPIISDNLQIEYSYFLNFVKDYSHLTPVRSEWIIYNEDLKIAGCIDMLFESDGKYYIYDWKRCNMLTYESNNYANRPCIRDIPNSNYNHYILQLNIYKYILESKYDIIIESLHLVVFYFGNSNYQHLDLKILSKDVMDDLLSTIYIK